MERSTAPADLVIEPYRVSADEAIAALGSNARLGLSESEARARLECHGRNELSAEKRPPAWRKFLGQFADPLVILLLVATAISAALWLLERDSALPYEAIAILAVVLLNALMGFIQESRAEEAVAALRRMAAAHADVVRGGTRQSIAAAEVVIEEDQSNPGYYNSKFFLRPHYQLEGLTVSLRLVSKLPSAKSS